VTICPVNVHPVLYNQRPIGHRPAHLRRLARPSGSRVLARILLYAGGKHRMPQPGACQAVLPGGYRWKHDRL